MLEDIASYQGAFNNNPFDFKAQFSGFSAISAECTTNGVPVNKAKVDLTKKHEIYDLLLHASGKKTCDAYLLDPDTFEEGYFIVPFDLTAVQDGGDSVTLQLQMLINVRIGFSASTRAALQALFLYNTDESLCRLTIEEPPKKPSDDDQTGKFQRGAFVPFVVDFKKRAQLASEAIEAMQKPIEQGQGPTRCVQVQN